MIAVRNGVLAVALLAGVAAAYANHFSNSFHFDDFHTITGNSAIRSLANVPLFFRDARTFSSLPTHYSYRPLLTASLALDYRLGGANPFWYHVTSFGFFLALVGCLWALGYQVFGADRAPTWLAAAIFALHPAMAETVNYLIQRGDILAALGVVAGVVTYAGWPGVRRYGIYLVPPLLGMLAKPSALIFAPILLAYVLIFEGWKPLRAVPALGLSAAFYVFQRAMTPASYVPTIFRPIDYWMTQPWVSLRYFVSFFLPLHLNADSDLAPIANALDARVLAGVLLCGGIGAVALIAARHREWRPVSFGLWWFLLGLIPTAVTPLAEVENDHRMFLPFIGLSMAAAGTAFILIRRFRVPAVAWAGGCAAILALAGWGVHQRNEVWHTEESLWREVTVKSPHNGRGLMNYGLTRMEKGDIQTAYEYFTRAQAFVPNYSLLEVNLGIASGALGRDGEAEAHFQRAIQLEPEDAQSYSYFAKWLWRRGRLLEAEAAFAKVAQLNPADSDARASLERVHAQAAAAPSGAEFLLTQSLAYYNRGLYQQCLEAARTALKLRPGYAEAWNNIAAANQAMHRWPDAIDAARQALRFKPDFQLARNNLAWSESQLRLAGRTD